MTVSLSPARETAHASNIRRRTCLIPRRGRYLGHHSLQQRHARQRRQQLQNNSSNNNDKDNNNINDYYFNE